MDLGMDFGSTYTTLSRFDAKTEQLQDILFNEGAPFVPSVVSINDKDGRWFFGRAAKTKTGKKGIDTYKAFKMMLPEHRAEQLQARGYTQERTPETVAGFFLSQCIQETLERCGQEQVEQLVVGVPEVWTDNFDTLDGRAILRRLCAQQETVDSVQIVSEPAAASAFFAYNYSKITGKNYDGHILLVDYGGGTLDITLTDVSLRDGSMEIKVDERTGAGENEQGKVGKAGIVYMESVMEEAIRQSEEFDGKELCKDSKFYKAVDLLEEEIKSSRAMIEEIFEEIGTDDFDALDDEEFTAIEYRGEEISVTFGTLARVYDAVIAPVFNSKLDEMIAFMERDGIDYSDQDQECFKIALVGGFGNYYLVNHQVSKKFKISSFDKRRKNIIGDASEREKAVSMGCALLASGVISIRSTAPYSIGLVGMKNGVKYNDFAIRYKQDIEYNHPYFVCVKEGGHPRLYFLSGKIDSFVINNGEDERTAIEVYLKDNLRKKLQDIADFADAQYQTAYIGFSLDSSGIVSIHIRPYNLFEKKAGETDHQIVLDSYSNMFSLTAIN